MTESVFQNIQSAQNQLPKLKQKRVRIHTIDYSLLFLDTFLIFRHIKLAYRIRQTR